MVTAQQARPAADRRMAALACALVGSPSHRAQPVAASPAPLKIAFIGFRHGHIGAVHSACCASGTFVVTGLCEEHAPTREALGSQYTFTHTSYAAMLDEVEVDIVAVGDYYGVRGERVIAALERGKHVIADKPLCTSLAELDRIEQLAAEKGLSVFCQVLVAVDGLAMAPQPR
jgi:predicted dehydrogenase